jgi:hypothetical protein
VLHASGERSPRPSEGEHVLAYDYPLLNLFWTMLIFFLWIAWFFLLFRVLADVFRSRDMGGFAKALWIIFVIFLPFLGVLVYVIARGNSMTQRDLESAKAQEQAFQSYVRDVASSSGGGAADELAKLADLKARGVITDAEFEAQKAKLLA